MHSPEGLGAQAHEDTDQTGHETSQRLRCARRAIGEHTPGDGSGGCDSAEPVTACEATSKTRVSGRQ